MHGVKFQELANLHNANGPYIKTTEKVRSRSVKETLKAKSIFILFPCIIASPQVWTCETFAINDKLLSRVLKTAKTGVSKCIFLSSHLNAIQKSHALMTFHELLYLGIIVVCSCVSWFLRIELGNMCNFRLSPSENFSAFGRFCIKRSNPCLLQCFPKPKTFLFTYKLRYFAGTSLRKTFFPTQNAWDRFYRHCLLNVQLCD